MSAISRRYALFFVWCILGLFYAMTLLQTIDLTREDLGRHLMNGKLVVQEGPVGNPVLITNLYSYTMPDAPFVNHHWLSGVIFERLYSVVGIRGLMIADAVMLLGMLWLMLRLIFVRSGSLFWTTAWGTVLVTLLADRHIVRPEHFTFLFLAIFLWIARYISQGEKISWKVIASTIFVQVLWTNLHIGFFFGPTLITIAAISFVLQKRKEKKFVFAHTIPHLFLVVGVFLATCINPHGLSGALYPLHIFADYGYRIVENIAPLELRSIIPYPIITVFLVVAFFAFIVSVLKLLLTRTMSFMDGMILVFSFILGFSAMRNMPLFALFLAPLLAESCTHVLRYLKHRLRANHEALQSVQLLGWAAVIVGGLGWFSFVFSGQVLFGVKLQKTTASLTQNQFSAANFFKTLNVQGAIFNNYDIGSYVIYTLYPQWRVFVDNRPEAYTTTFFQDQYIPMQERDDIWQQQLQAYNFRTIFFSHKDLTPWSQTFLSARLRDPDWKVVYIDSYVIIFLRNFPEYAELIRQYSVTPEGIQYYLQRSITSGV